MSETTTSQKVIHPMAKFQRQVQTLVKRQVVKPSDSIWKIAFLFGDEWSHWRKELEDFDFSTKDPISDLLAVESWEDE
ncbi:DUF4327 family protein [Oscillatoria sp. CS-180]|uniref:DUF4327 family protein n=1 Tax=Oscillatoria sp. CS-180 TaxID=3021720 RepID=UPI00232AE7C5|nr:DUF4327 family protein [Oscillatoria sp. CS-180]MDB9526569.1 DUF4327 family protein [Oscillatoria sp. CS-180]